MNEAAKSKDQTGEDAEQKQQQQEDNGPDYEEEIVIDAIVNHSVNRAWNHRYAKKGIKTYGVRWFGFTLADDSREPISHLPLSKVLSFLADIDKVIED